MKAIFLSGAVESTRSGKSCFANSLIATLAQIPYCALILCDPKKTEFRRYKNRSSIYLSSQKEIDIALKAIVAEVERRYSWIEENSDASRISTGKQFPFLAVVVDELSYLLNSEDKKLNESIISSLTKIQIIGLASGVSLIGMTQRPTVEALGGNKGSQFRSQFIQRLAFRMNGGPTDTDVVLGAGMGRLYPAHALPKNCKGVGYLASENLSQTSLIRGFYITDEKAKEVAEKNKNLRVPLPWLDEAIRASREGDCDEG